APAVAVRRAHAARGVRSRSSARVRDGRLQVLSRAQRRWSQDHYMRSRGTSEVQILAEEPATLSGAEPRDSLGASVPPALKVPARGGGSDGESREDHAARGGPGGTD